MLYLGTHYKVATEHSQITSKCVKKQAELKVCSALRVTMEPRAGANETCTDRPSSQPWTGHHHSGIDRTTCLLQPFGVKTENRNIQLGRPRYNSEKPEERGAMMHHLEVY